MTGNQFKNSIERLLNINIKNATGSDIDALLGVINTSKDEIAEIIHTQVNERYFAITETSPVTGDTIKTVALPITAFGSVYSVVLINQETNKRREALELIDRPVEEETIRTPSYAFEMGRLVLYGIDDNETMAIIEYDQYPLNITEAELNDNTQDLSEVINLPRPAHTALMRKVVYEMIRATDSAYRAEVIGVVRTDAMEAIQNMVTTLKRRNQSRNIIPPVNPIITQDV